MTLSSLTDYGKTFQLKLLAALLTDKRFLMNVQDILKLDYFASDADKWIVQEIIKYYHTYNTVPTMEVLQIEYKKISNDVLRIAVREELKNAYKATQDDLEYVKEEFTSFCRNQEMKNAILESADLLQSGNYEAIRARIDIAMKAGQDKNIGHEYKKDVESRYREDYRPTIATPWTPLNDLLAGGLGPGDLFLIFGGPGIGKSWLAVAMGAEAVRNGYNVNYYTLELGEQYVARRFDSYFTGYTVDELRERREEVDKLMEDLPGNLTIKEYAPKEATISMLEAHIQECANEGIKPDLIIIDYIDYLSPPKNTKFSERKDAIDDVYIGAKGLAKRLNVPVISPSQVNRSGAREQVVEGDRAAGSYDKLMVTDAAISLSRQKEDKVLGTGRIHMMKNRYGPDGITYNIKMDTNRGLVEFDSEETDPAPESKPMRLSRDVIAEFFGKKE